MVGSRVGALIRHKRISGGWKPLKFPRWQATISWTLHLSGLYGATYRAQPMELRCTLNRSNTFLLPHLKCSAFHIQGVTLGTAFPTVACHVCPLPVQPWKLDEMRIKQVIDLHPRVRMQLSAGFPIGFFSCGIAGLVFMVVLCCAVLSLGTLAVPSILATRWIKPGCGLMARVCSLWCWVIPAFIRTVYLCPALPQEPFWRQSIRPLHEGFLFLIKLACALPRGTCWSCESQR